MNEAERWLFNKARPDFKRKGANDFVQRGKRPEQALDEAKAHIAAFINQFQRRNVRIVRTNLAIANYAVAGKLKAGKAKLDQTLGNQPD